MPPSRKASPARKSPAPERATSAGRPSKSPAPSRPAKSPPAKSPKKSPAKAPTAAATEAEPPAPPAAAPAPAPKATKSAPKPSGSAGSGLLTGALVVLLCALVGGAYFWPMSSKPLQGAPRLSAKAFNAAGDLRPGRDRYAGSALVFFTLNTQTDHSCAACNDFDALTKSRPFQEQLSTWWSAGTLRVGKVYCNDHEELCSRFADLDPKPKGVWFKGGKAVGRYDEEITLAGLRKWADKSL